MTHYDHGYLECQARKTLVAGLNDHIALCVDYGAMRIFFRLIFRPSWRPKGQ